MNDRQREYERLVAPIEDRMMRAVWRVTGSPTDAEDALQEALLANGVETLGAHSETPESGCADPAYLH